MTQRIKITTPSSKNVIAIPPVSSQKIVVRQVAKESKTTINIPPEVEKTTEKIWSLDVGLLGGTWFQIARSGTNKDLLEGAALIEWKLIPRDAGYLSVTLILRSRDGKQSKWNGNAIISSVGIISITLQNPQSPTIINLGQYVIHYSDYANYTFIGTAGDLWIWSRNSYINPTEVSTLLTMAEHYGYVGSSLQVNRSSLVTAATTPLARTVVDIIPSKVFDNKLTSSRFGGDKVVLNTKISLDDEIEEKVINPVIVSSSPYFSRTPSILVKNEKY